MWKVHPVLEGSYHGVRTLEPKLIAESSECASCSLNNVNFFRLDLIFARYQNLRIYSTHLDDKFMCFKFAFELFVAMFLAGNYATSFQ